MTVEQLKFELNGIQVFDPFRGCFSKLVVCKMY